MHLNSRANEHISKHILYLEKLYHISKHVQNILFKNKKKVYFIMNKIILGKAHKKTPSNWIEM